jgi:hypothetical protein
MENPRKTLKKTNQVLKKGGYVLIDLPNYGCLQALLLGSHWPLLLPKEHNFHFNKVTLLKTITSANLKVVYSETRSGVFDYDKPLVELFSAFFSFKKRFFNELIFLPISLLETLLGMGSCLTVIAKK